MSGLRCLIVVPFRDTSTNITYALGDVVTLDDPAKRERWTAQGLIRPFPESSGPAWPWDADGRQLFGLLPHPRRWKRIVACLNVWNDLPYLQETVPRWLDQVDRVIAVDGCYAQTPKATPGSSDGTLDFLAALPRTTFIRASGFWRDQIEKRNTYLRYAERGDLLFIVDADEYVECRTPLRAFDGEVGWVQLTSPQYTRPYVQPRLIAFRPGLEYRGRHHWLWDGPRLVATHQYGGIGFDHRLAAVRIANQPVERRGGERRWQREVQRMIQSPQEKAVVAGSATSDRAYAAREPLRILQLGLIDPGLVSYRLHTALNTTTPHASVFGCGGDENPFAGPRQFELTQDRETLRFAAWEADVIHSHASWFPWESLGIVRREPVLHVIHHHGTHYRQAYKEQNKRDAVMGAALRLVSNLELLQYGEDLHYLPNPVPVARYLYAAPAIHGLPRPLRVAHSPSKRALKGTAEFLAVCERLRAQGVPIEPVLIEQRSHAESLGLKATCHACFDSFWLGMQCSGIEAAAMGRPVIAGDRVCAAEATQRWGHVPWTFAANGTDLETVLAALATDEAYWLQERNRVFDHVLQYHDYAAVALAYLDLLDAASGWRDRLAVTTVV